MTRLKRWLWLGMALLVLVVLGLGGWFSYRLIVSTNAMLQRAETFSFRRMTVAQLAEQGGYRFFYATNRAPGPDQESIDEWFGNERRATLRFGSFDTEIEPTLGIGMIINPTEWFQNEEIRLRNVQPLDQSAFVAQLRAFVQASPYRSLLVVVHGFREAFPSALRKTAFLGHVLDINSPVLLFDWPGNQGSTPLGYRRAQRVAEASGAELAQTIDLIIREVQPKRLWLIANSMGAQVVADAFSLLYQQANFADAATEIEDVVLTAPDVDLAEFDEQFKREIGALARDLTVYVSSNDQALLMSRVLNWGRRLGESTLRPGQVQETEGVTPIADSEGPPLTLVDVTPVNRTRNFHNFSLETPEFFDDLFLRLTNSETPRSRLLYPIQTPEGQVYWLLTSGR